MVGTEKLSDILNKNRVLDKKNTGSIKAALEETADKAKADHKEAEARMQVEIQNLSVAKRRGDAKAEKAAQAEINTLKVAMAKANATQRNTESGIKTMDKDKK
jgi:hypothetical protein